MSVEPQAPGDRRVVRATEPAAPAVDERQDEIMTERSSDGRPPPKRLRTVEWWAAGAVGVLVLIVVASVMAARGFSAGTIAVVLGVGLVMMGAAWPAWTAGLMRGREERQARDRAHHEMMHPPR